MTVDSTLGQVTSVRLRFPPRTPAMQGRYYDTNLAIASDYLRARMDTQRASAHHPKVALSLLGSHRRQPLR